MLWDLKAMVWKSAFFPWQTVKDGCGWWRSLLWSCVWSRPCEGRRVVDEGDERGSQSILRKRRYLREWLCLVRGLVSKKNHREFRTILCIDTTQLYEAFSKGSRSNAEMYESPAFDISCSVVTYFV